MHHSFNSNFNDSGLDNSYLKSTSGKFLHQKNLQSKNNMDNMDTFSTYNTSSSEFSSSEQEIHHGLSSEETCDNCNKVQEREYNEAVQTGACLRLYDAAVNRRKRLDSKSRGSYIRKKVHTAVSRTYVTRAQAKQLPNPRPTKCKSDEIKQHPSKLDSKTKTKKDEMNCVSTSFTIKKVHSVHDNIMTCNSQEQGIEVALLSDDTAKSLLRVLDAHFSNTVKRETSLSETCHESQMMNVPQRRLATELINEKIHEESGQRMYERAVQSQKALQKKIAMIAKEKEKMLREKRKIITHVNRHSERILARKSDQSYNKASRLSKLVRSDNVDALALGDLMESINTVPEEYRAETLKKVLHDVL